MCLALSASEASFATSASRMTSSGDNATPGVVPAAESLENFEESDFIEIPGDGGDGEDPNPGDDPPVDQTIAPVNLVPVAIEGGAAPGVQSDAVFGPLYPPVMNREGQVAFIGALDGSTDGITDANDQGVWSNSRGSLDLVVREGNLAPGANGDTFTPHQRQFGFVRDLDINTNGDIVFEGFLLNPENAGFKNYGIWSEGSGPLGLVARWGRQAPGTNDGSAFYQSSADLPIFRLDGTGGTAFTSLLRDLDADEGRGRALFYEKDGTTRLLVRSGDIAVDELEFSKFDYLEVNDAGQILLMARLGESFIQNSSIWVGTPGGLELVVLGLVDQVPDFPAGAFFRRFPTPAFNENGRIAFSADAHYMPVDFDSEVIGRGIWSNHSGNLNLVVRDGDRAPGTPDEVVFEEFEPVILRDNGHVVFKADLRIGEGGVTVDNNTGIWAGDAANLRLIAREGSLAPGAPEGYRFDTFSQPVVNASGQIGFFATLRLGPEGIPPYLDSLWIASPSGELSRVLCEDDLVDIDPGPDIDANTVVDIIFNGGFSDAGEFAVQLVYAKGIDGADRGIYMVSPSTASSASGYAAWAQAYGLAGADAEPEAILMGDGITNLLKYGLGLSPSDYASPQQLPRADLVGPVDDRKFAFEHRRLINNAPTYEYYTTDDLRTPPNEWTLYPQTPTVMDPDTDGDGEVEAVRIEIP